MEFNRNRGRYPGASPFMDNNLYGGGMGYNNNMGDPGIMDPNNRFGGRPDIGRDNFPMRDSVQGESIENNGRGGRCGCHCDCDNDIGGESTNNCPNVQCRNTLGIAPDLALAMAYVPDQQWCDIYDCNVGFQQGTIFKRLDKPLSMQWR